MFKEIESAHLIQHRYESMSDFADYQDTHQLYGRCRKDFAGVATISEAAERARKGLPAEGIKVLKLSRSLTASAMKRVERMDMCNTFDTAGSYVDMGRFVEGEPECMVETHYSMVPVVNPVVTIVSNVNASGGIDKADLERRGRLVVALIKAVETSGRSTELWVDSTNKSKTRDHAYRISVQVKRASQPINMGNVMYGFSDPSMLRALCFNAMHALPARLQSEYGVGAGYGCVPTDGIRVEESYGKGVVYLPAVRWGENERTAEETVTRVLSELGITG